MAFKIGPAASFGAGYAWLEVDAAVARDVTFFLSCPNRPQPYLSDNGWQGSPYPWRPRQVDGTRNGARLLVGPEIVDRILNDELVRIQIAEIDYVAEASWEGVPVSGVRPTRVDEDQEDIERPVPASELPPSSPPPTPIVLNAKPPDEPTTPTRTRGDETEARIVDEPAASSPAAEPSPPPRHRWLIVAAAVLGVGLGVFFGHKYVATVPIYASPSEPPAPAQSVEEAQRLLASPGPAVARLFQLGVEIHGAPSAPRELGLAAIRRAAELGYEVSPSNVDGHSPRPQWVTGCNRSNDSTPQNGGL